MNLKVDRRLRTNGAVNSTYNKLLMLLILSLLSIILIKSSSVVANSPISFDGALNALGAHSLLNSKNINFRGIDFFDPRIQTGVTLTLPAALLFSVFGESFEIGLIPNFLYLISFVFGIYYYYKKGLGLGNAYVLISLLFFMFTPQLFALGFGLYGELPALTFFLYSIIMVSLYRKKGDKSYIFVSGLLVGLSYLTKTVLLIAIVGYAIAFMFHLLSPNQSIRESRRLAIKFCLGFTLPVIFLEIIKWGYMGTHRYLLWWKEMSLAISQQAGVVSGYSDTPGVLQKFLTHLSLLSEYINLSPILITMLLVIVIFSLTGSFFYSNRNKRTSFENIHDKRSVPFDFFVLLLVTFIYFAWWLLITPTQKAWYRRVFNAVLLLEVSLPVVIAFTRRYIQSFEGLWKGFTSHQFEVISKLVFLSLFTIAIAGSLSQDVFNIKFKNTPLKEAYLSGAAFVQTLPSSAKIYGTGWWQAPILSFTAQRDFFDINPEIETLVLQPKLIAFLAEDHYVIDLDHAAIQKVLERFTSTLIFDNKFTRIYKLNNLSP